MIISAARMADDLTGVFEHDGDTGFFYLFDRRAEIDQKVVAAIWILNGEADFGEQDIEIRWDPSDNIVGLLIRGRLWAAHDSRSLAKYGGDYRSGQQPAIPEAISLLFGSLRCR